MESIIAAVLLIGGGLATLQTAAVSTGLPFALVLLISVYSLYVGFSQEAYVENAVKRAVSEAIDEKRLQEAVSLAVEGEVISPEPMQSR
jgi:choline/glycine/proline betaine transport protein